LFPENHTIKSCSSGDYDQGKNAGQMHIRPSNKSPKEIRAVNFENRVRVRVGRKMRTTYGGKSIEKDKLANPHKAHKE
jgi:hypothetical protein